MTDDLIERLRAAKPNTNFGSTICAAHVWEAADRIATQQEAIDELVEHIREQTEHFKVRIEDGKQLGATVWRLALEDMVRENAAFLATLNGEKKDG